MGDAEVSWERMRAIKTFDQFYDQCTQGERLIVDELRDLIFEYADFTEKITYGVPYYNRNRQVCFIWAASAAFGPKSGVQFGFCQGNLLNDTHGLLERGSRKQVFWITIQRVEEINHRILREYLMQAVDVDGGFKEKRRTKQHELGIE